MDASKAKKEASEIKKARCVILNLHLSAYPLIFAYYPVFCATVNLFFGKYSAFGTETGFKLDSLKDEEARNFPDETIKTCETWWNVFVEADKSGKLDDVKYLKDTLIREAGLVMPDLEVTKTSMQVMLGGINLFRKIFGKKPIKVAEVQLETIAGWLAKGYRTYSTGA